jgi:hypothetical protein
MRFFLLLLPSKRKRQHRHNSFLATRPRLHPSEPDYQATTFHHRRHHHRGDDLRALLRRRHNSRALDGRIGSVPHNHSQLYVEQLEIVVDQIPVCAQCHFLDGHSRRVVNRRHMSRLLAAAIDVVAGLHIPQYPIARISATSTMQEISYIPDGNRICSDQLAAAVAAAVVLAIAAALAPSASFHLPAAFSAALIVESAHEDAFAAPWLSRNT